MKSNSSKDLKQVNSKLFLFGLLMMLIVIPSIGNNLSTKSRDSSQILREDDKIRVKSSQSNFFSNISVISDGYQENYWNDGFSVYPSLAVDSSGNVHVVWYDTTDGFWGTDTEIMYANYTEPNGWSNATVISDGYQGSYWNDGASVEPSIAVDGTGNIHVAWRDSTNGVWGGIIDDEIMYANYTSANGWSNATVISDGYQGSYWNDGFSYIPSLAVDGTGNVHVVWIDTTNGTWGTDGEIMYCNYTSANGWSNATVISDGYQGSYWNDEASSAPSLVVDSTGNIHVVWFDYTEGVWGTDIEIMYCNYTSANGWSNATLISDGYQGSYWNDGGSYNPKIAVNGSGNVHVVWLDITIGVWGGSGGDPEIMYTNYSTQAGWSNATVISDGYQGSYWNDDYSVYPSLAVDSSGNVHVAWEDWTDGEWGTDKEIMYCNYTAATEWSNATVISDGYQGSYWNDGDSEYPSLAVDGTGNVHVVWIDVTNGTWGTDSEIMYASYFFTQSPPPEDETPPPDTSEPTPSISSFSITLMILSSVISIIIIIHRMGPKGKRVP